MNRDAILAAFGHFATIVYKRVLVSYVNEVRFELRLYMPQRVTQPQLLTLYGKALNVYVEVAGPSADFTLESNRSGMCFNAFVPESAELLAIVNEAREMKNLKPIRL